MGGLSGRLREPQDSLPEEVRTNLHWKRINCMQFLTNEVSKQTSMVNTANIDIEPYPKWSYRRIKTVIQKSGHGRLHEVVVYDRFQLWWIWLGETLVAYLRWSLKKGGRIRRLDCMYLYYSEFLGEWGGAAPKTATKISRCFWAKKPPQNTGQHDFLIQPLVVQRDEI